MYMFLFDLFLLKLGAAPYSTLLICMLYILQTHRSRDSFSAVFTRFDFDKTLNTTAKPSLMRTYTDLVRTLCCKSIRSSAFL